MTITTAAEPELSGSNVIYLPWDDYLSWLGGKLTSAANAHGETLKLGPPLAPGQHMPVIGPTGCAKTTHAVGALGELRNFVLALDPKGEDETLTASGYVRVKSLPKEGPGAWWDRVTGQGDQRAWNDIYKRIEQGRPARVIVGGGSRSDKEDEALRSLMRQAITFSRHSGGWTLFVDEFELLSSQRMMRLGDMIERMLITARRDKTSVVTTYQAPAWVSKHATRQASKAVVYPQAGNMVKNIAEEMNQEWRELGAILDELPQYYTVTVGRGRLAGPAVVTRAPKLPERKPQNGGSSPDAARDRDRPAASRRRRAAF